MSKGLKLCTKEQYERFLANHKKPLAVRACTVGDPPSVSYFHGSQCVARSFVAWGDKPAEYRIRH